MAFFHTLIHNLWVSRRVIELAPYPKESGAVLYYLRTFSKLTGQQLADRCGISVNTLAKTEGRNSKLSMELCEKLRIVASDYYLPHMARWFAEQKILASGRKRPTPRGRTPE